jgi:hypothetical protein
MGAKRREHLEVIDVTPDACTAAGSFFHWLKFKFDQSQMKAHENSRSAVSMAWKLIIMQIE